jgi:hypothetical protein
VDIRFPSSIFDAIMPRTIQPELLDSLPPQHPDALHNRRDLRITNRLMGNYRWFVRVLPQVASRGESLLEIGAGTGELASSLQAGGLQVDGLDLWPKPSNWPDTRIWHQDDLLAFSGYEAYDVVFGNLIFHQFKDDELAKLGASLQSQVRAIVACEPARRRLSQIAYRLAGPILGVNYVSLHDAHVSIEAGFLGDELPRALGLDNASWQVRCHTTPLGAYRMIAVRRS